jgi:hypothetical protein
MKKLIIPIAAVLACLSCAPPPFNLDLSLSARTARALTLEGTAGPIDKMYSISDLVDAVFLPEKGTPSGLDLTNGFVALTSSRGDRQLVFVHWDQTKGMYLQAGDSMDLGPAPKDSYPDRLLVTVKGTQHLVCVFALSSSAPSANQVVLGQADPAGGNFPVGTPAPQPLGSLAMTTTGTTGDVIGVARYPQKDPALDCTYWLLKTSGNLFLELRAYTPPSYANPPSELPTRPGPPAYSLGTGMPFDGLSRGLYYYDPEPSRAPERSYLSWYDQARAQWRCWVWSGAVPFGPTELTGVVNRVDAVLTTGELFSTEGEVGRLYTRGGVLRTTFPLTGMRFIEESYINGEARVLFSQYLYFNGRPSFNVYSIPTTDLDTLGG